MESGKKIIVVMPAYNTANVLKKTFGAMPKELVDEIILVDDGSSDDTANIARKLGMVVVSHGVNRGYGAAQKTGYSEAIKRGADGVVLLHSDNQYDPALLNKFIEAISEGGSDVVTGSRIAYGGAVKSGMPPWKYVSNRFLTGLENLILGTALSDYHNGYRAYSAGFLKQIPFEKFSDGFDFDTDIIVQAAIRKRRILEIPHKTRYEEDNSKMSFGRGIIYGLSILKTLFLYKMHEWGILKNELFEKVR